MDFSDTICAISTAPGSGAIALVRLSGADALTVAGHVFNSKRKNFNIAAMPSHTAAFGTISNPSGIIDEVVMTVFRAPHSFTGEDVIEFGCHGSQYIQQQILQTLIANGARMAAPGEFTQRAFLNGKMDLSQAEAVADLIASTGAASHRVALNQMRGGISTELAHLRDELLKTISLVELELDFSEEDVEFADRSQLRTLLNNIGAEIDRLIKSFSLGNAIKNGVPVAIIGEPNVGKSTLLNAILKEDRAIVSDIAGTTRDAIEDTINIDGVTYRFIDTAGIRQTTDQVEQIGIQRTYQAIAKARVVLWLIDDAPDRTEILDMAARCQGRALIVVQNKIDKRTIAYDGQCVKISAKYGQGLDQLEAAIFAAADIPEISETDIVVSSARQYHALVNARNDLSRVISSLQENLSADLVSEDLNLVLDSLSEITGQGRIVPTEVLSNIFKNFCVGK